MFDRVNSSDGGEMPKERSRQKKKKKRSAWEKEYNLAKKAVEISRTN